MKGWRSHRKGGFFGRGKNTKRTRSLGFDSLEDRRLLAITTTFSGGELTIDSDEAGDTITVTASGGNVQINGANPSGGARAASTVTSIRVFGRQGNDTINLSGVTTSNFANIVDVLIVGGEGNDSIIGSDYDDIIYGHSGNDTIRGGNGDDDIRGNLGNDSLLGEAGDDLIIAGRGDDTVNGGADDDTLLGCQGNDSLVGGTGNDDLNGHNGVDTLAGNAGDDIIRGERGNDIIGGDEDNDELRGNEGNDMIEGDAGTDMLRAGPGNDTLRGGAGNDTLKGNDGDDDLDGEAGDDIQHGGRGTDTYSDSSGNNTSQDPDGNTEVTPTISVADVSIMEGDSGTKTVVVTATLSQAASSTVTVGYATSDGTAQDADGDGDYVEKTGTLTFNTGSTTATVTLTINGDEDFEADETFNVTLSNVTGPAILDDATAQVTILNDDEEPAGANEFDVSESTAADGDSVGTVTPSATLSGDVIYQFNDSTPAALMLVPDDHLSGNVEGSVVLIEYLDIQCPTCLAYHPVVQDLKDTFATDLLVVSRHLPLTSVHLNAFDAAVAAEAAGLQGKFDEMVDILFDNQSEWASEADPQSLFEGYATQIGLNVTQFTAALDDVDLADRVQRDLDAATAMGDSSTPTFYVNGTKIALPNNVSDFNTVIENARDAVTGAFGINRETGEIFIRDATALNATTTPTVTLDVKVQDENGTTETIQVTIDVAS